MQHTVCVCFFYIVIYEVHHYTGLYCTCNERMRFPSFLTTENILLCTGAKVLVVTCLAWLKCTFRLTQWITVMKSFINPI